jgi:hypothetical protein
MMAMIYTYVLNRVFPSLLCKPCLTVGREHSQGIYGVVVDEAQEQA